MNLHKLAIEMAQTNENATSTKEGADETKTKPTRSDHIKVLITSGPHADSKHALLRPKANAPCFIGRSKGKKFIKNGISLSKDQEVSTTHAKILVEGLGLGDGNSTGRDVKFYFVDVGSTNGSSLDGEMLEPDVKVLIGEGMEIKVGMSTLKFILG